MKREMDLIRAILLEIENRHDGSGSAVTVEIEGYSHEQITEHLFMLREAGFIEGVDSSHMDGRDIIVLRMTWSGHEFLETVRDPEIWRKTKSVAVVAGGWTAGILSGIAGGLIKAKLQQLGVAS